MAKGYTLEELQSMGAKPTTSGGLTEEQLKNMGAKKVGGGDDLDYLTGKTTEPTPSFIERIKQDLIKRGKSVDVLNGPIETPLQIVGQGAGFITDILGEAAKSLVEKTPSFIKEPIKHLGADFLETEPAKAGLKAIQGGVEMYQDWKQKNPRLALDLESVVNIGTLLPIGKGAQLGLKTTGKLAGKGATALEKGLAEQGFKDALEIIKPVLSKTEKQEALEAGRGIVKNRILPRRYEKITLEPTKREIEMAETIKDIVSKSKNPVDNINAIDNEIGRLANVVQEGLKANNTIFNKNQLKTALGKAKEGSRVVFGTDKTLQSSYDAVIDEMLRQVDETSGNLSGLLQARKNFDNIINQKFPNLLSSPMGDSARQNAVRDVRQAVNQFIADKLPEGNEFKELLKKQNLMYDAIGNISKKTASAVDASVVKKVMSLLRENPLTSFATGGILTYGAMMGMFTNPIVIGTLILGGTVKIGKTIVTSKVFKQSLVNILRAWEKVGTAVDVSAIREIINQLPD